MLDCCEDLEKVKKQGISFRQFVCLAQCHGLAVIPKRPQQDTTMSYECCCVETPEDSPSTPLQDSEENQPAERRLLTKVVPIQTSLAAFREDVQECCRSAQLPMLIVSYSRKEFKQTGDGHFSPIAAFHEESDHVLILGTNNNFTSNFHLVCRTSSYIMSENSGFVGNRKQNGSVVEWFCLRTTDCVVHGSNPTANSLGRYR